MENLDACTGTSVMKAVHPASEVTLQISDNSLSLTCPCFTKPPLKRINCKKSQTSHHLQTFFI